MEQWKYDSNRYANVWWFCRVEKCNCSSIQLKHWVKAIDRWLVIFRCSCLCASTAIQRTTKWIMILYFGGECLELNVRKIETLINYAQLFSHSDIVVVDVLISCLHLFVAHFVHMKIDAKIDDCEAFSENEAWAASTTQSTMKWHFVQSSKVATPTENQKKKRKTTRMISNVKRCNFSLVRGICFEVDVVRIALKWRQRIR